MKSLTSLSTILLMSILLSFNSYATNAEISPYKVIESTGKQLFTRISNDQESLKKFPELMRNIVEEELMPSIDYKYAAFKILGKNLKKLTKAQREKFVISMRSYLVRTYATALHQYNDQKVSFESERPTNKAKIVGVDAVISDTNAPDITITFQMRQNRKSKQWKAYDMIVEGISLLSSKQAEISRRISKNGVDQVTIELAALSQ
jgi:phospholipid transport system substrate-binding protein